MSKRLLPALLFVCAASANASPVFTQTTDSGEGEAQEQAHTGSTPRSSPDLLSLSSASYGANNQSIAWSHAMAASATGASSGDNHNNWSVTSSRSSSTDYTDAYTILKEGSNTNTISAYVFGSLNRINRSKPQGMLLGGIERTIATSTNAIINDASFSIDATSVNTTNGDTQWDGIAFGDELGFWFNPTGDTTSSTTTTASANVTVADSKVQVSATSSSLTILSTATATAIPEPTSIALLSIGAAVCFGLRRRNNKLVPLIEQ